SASQVDRNVSSAAAIVAKPKPSPRNAKIAAPTARPMPTVSAVTFFFTSRAANSISRRASAEACSATDFAAPPTPPFACCSVTGVCMAPPVENLRQDVAADERRAENNPRLPSLRPLQLRTPTRGRAARRLGGGLGPRGARHL